MKQFDVVACGVCFVSISITILAVRLFMSFQFPLPWPDEAAFVSQAFAFYRTGSFFVPALNPDRILMWMPPGYMLMLAASFKLFGYSFSLSRWLSCIFAIANAGIVIILVKRLLSGWPLAFCLFFTVGVFVTPDVIVNSNIARMECFFEFIILLSLLACLKGRVITALSLVVGSALVHFNAIYFLGPVMFLFYHTLATNRLPFVKRGELPIAGLIALLALTYLCFIMLHMQAFFNDMSWQFHHKTDRPFDGTWRSVSLMILPVTMASAAILTTREFGGSVVLFSYGAAFFGMAVIGQEIWYRYGLSLGLLLSAIGCCLLFEDVKRTDLKLGLIAALGVIGLAATHYAWQSIRRSAAPKDLIEKRVVSYSDRARIKEFIATLPRGSTVSFSFGLDGIEPFFFDALAKAGADWLITPYSMTVPGPLRTPDWRVHCDSALYRGILVPLQEGNFPLEAQDSGCTILLMHK